MRAMLLDRPAGAGGDASALRPVDVAPPRPGDDDVVVRVSVCGVCRTDLDLVEGRLVAPRYPVTPGHQIVGEVTAIGAAVEGRRIGERVGIAWIHHACGHC